MPLDTLRFQDPDGTQHYRSGRLENTVSLSSWDVDDLGTHGGGGTSSALHSSRFDLLFLCSDSQHWRTRIGSRLLGGCDGYLSEFYDTGKDENSTFRVRAFIVAPQQPP